MSRHIAIVSNLTSDEFRLPGHPDECEQIEAALRQFEPGWFFSSFRASEGHLPQDLSAIDGVVFSGSPASVNEDAPWIGAVLSFIRRLHELRIPMAGICFGHQAIAKALGGDVGSNPGGWSLGAVPVAWEGSTGAAQTGQNALTLYAVHNEQVLQAPEGAEIAAHTANCPIAGLRIGHHVLTTQHHPEMSREFVEAVLDKLADIPDAGLTDLELATARLSLDAPAHSAFLLQSMASLLSGEQPRLPAVPPTAAFNLQ